MIVADTSAILALLDADDPHHGALLAAYDEDPDEWTLPWAVLPEIDHLLLRHVSAEAELLFLRDLAEGAFVVEWGVETDLARARAVCERYRDLGLGLVDGVVVAVAERLRARAIATLDLRHFGAIEIEGRPDLLPRNL